MAIAGSRRGYRQTLEDLRAFPDEKSIRRLRELKVRFVLINRVHYSEEEFNSMLAGIMASPSFWPPRAFGPDEDQILIAELKEAEGPR